MTSGADVALRPATGADWSLIHRWLCQDEVQRWWGSLAAAEAEVIAALQADMGLCSIIEASGEPIGYAQALEAVYAGPALPSALTAGTFRVDAFIGEPGYRRKGAGVAALRLVAAEVFATTLAPAVIAVAAIRHEAAIRAYERAGFRWVRVIEDPLFGPSWLMRQERS